MTRTSDSLIFELSDFDREIADVIPGLSGRQKWSALSAIRHLNRAWKIKTIDPEMAVFRAITAEEESATALFYSLRHLQYEGAKKLKPHNHVHKNAVVPFLRAIGMAFQRVPFEEIEGTFHIVDHNNRRAIQVRWKVPWLPDNIRIESVGPLHFTYSEGKKGSESHPANFIDQLQQLAEQTESEDIIDHIRERANLRNQLLYAAPDGLPAVEVAIEPILAGYQKRVFANLCLLLMIDPYAKKQDFVQHALNVFLQVVRAVPRSIQFQ